MKFVLRALLVAALGTITSCALNIEMATKKEMQYIFVYEAPGVGKSLMFERCQRWVARTFVSAKTVIDVADKEARSMIAKVVLPIQQIEIGERWSSGLVQIEAVEATMVIDMKDERMRVAFEQVVPIGKAYHNRLGEPIRSSAALHRQLRIDLSSLSNEMHAAVIDAGNDF